MDYLYVAHMFTSVIDRCLGFWYHMYGNGVGTLKVYTRSSASPNTRQPAWSKQGDQGDTWHQAKINIYASNGLKVNA